jgi:hypothetical protein
LEKDSCFKQLDINLKTDPLEKKAASGMKRALFKI